MPTIHARRGLLAVVLATAALVSACGDGASAPANDTDGAVDACGTAVAAKAPGSVEVIAVGYLYEGARRQVVQVGYGDVEFDCHVEKRGRAWVVTALRPSTGG